MRGWLAGAALLGALSADRALAIPVVYASDDGVNRGVVEIVEGSGPTPLVLWLDDPGQAVFEYLVSFDATAGLALVDFTPAPSGDGLVASEQVFVPGDGGELALISGSALEPVLGPIRIGTLLVDPLAVGAELLLAPLAGVAPPVYVDTEFGLVPIATPQLVARVAPVPEARALLLFAAGAAVVLFSLRCARV